jgi:hypothetical protein
MRRSVMIAVATFGLLCAREAAAKDMNGRVGVGAERTLGGVEGIDVTYWVGKIAIDGTLAIGLSFPDMGDSGVSLSLAGGALFQLLGGDTAGLLFGGRLNIGTAPNKDVQIAIEAPLRLEWWPADHFSIHAEVGLAVSIVGDKGGNLIGAGGVSPIPGTAFVVGGTYLTAGAGFSVYF